MNPFADRITGTKHKNRSRQLMHHSTPSPSRHKKLATLFLAEPRRTHRFRQPFLWIAREPSDHTDPATEYSESKEHPAPISSPQDGAEIYLTRCMSCHQINGGGVPGRISSAHRNRLGNRR